MSRSVPFESAPLPEGTPDFGSPSESESLFRRLILWRSIKVTTPIFFGGLCAFYFFSSTRLTLISSVCYLSLCLLAFCFIRRVVMKRQLPDLALTADMLLPYLTPFCSSCAALANEFTRLFAMDDLVRSLQCAGALLVVGWISKYIPGGVLLFIGYLAAFTIPMLIDRFPRQAELLRTKASQGVMTVVGVVLVALRKPTQKQR
eukprot:gnl/Trimastix_PCT/2955.p3 GENE.gnl/Trimastix_PCT/2955~~gnl/Trimastix_PCT/2955.p3  ORF type:complete len:203 (-),score=34.33 gnl/Trimastix_PCT/2955:733-1341(-)